MHQITRSAKLASGSGEIFYLLTLIFVLCLIFLSRGLKSRTSSNFDVRDRYSHLKINVFNKRSASMGFRFHDLAQGKNDLENGFSSLSTCFLCQFFLPQIDFFTEIVVRKEFIYVWIFYRHFIHTIFLFLMKMQCRIRSYFLLR